MNHSESPSSAPRRLGWLYLLLLAAANMMWAGQGTAVKYLEPYLGPIAITFLPFYVTTLLLVPILLWTRARNPHGARPSMRDWWRFAVAGVGGQVLAQLGMTWGIHRSKASNAAILNLMIPVISAALASLMLGERLTRLRVTCLAIGLCGVMMMSQGDLSDSSLLGESFLTGNLLILAGCCGSAFYNVYCKGLLARYGEVEILIYSYITASIAALPLLLWVEPFHFEMLGQLDARAWWALGFLAVFMYGASMLLFFYVLQYVPVTVASASLYLVPVFGVAFAMFFLHETLSPLSILGALVVLVSTVLIMRYDAASG